LYRNEIFVAQQRGFPVFAGTDADSGRRYPVCEMKNFDSFAEVKEFITGSINTSIV
jgi:hypothetical protein